MMCRERRSPNVNTFSANSRSSASIDDGQVSEGDSGLRDMLFTVTLSEAAGKPESLSYSTANGTATAGIDYTGYCL